MADVQREGKTDTPHHRIELVDDAGVHYRIAVNVPSQQTPSELLSLCGRGLPTPDHRGPPPRDPGGRRCRRVRAARTQRPGLERRPVRHPVVQ
ncbi:MAG: hypothetical protein ACRDSK_00090 [Actinophytocola sp.]|uniref:hypothetical protein n=1 Tax=Actinophytocola sp. TaxID=1872138 RepID=UPI003D6C69F1